MLAKRQHLRRPPLPARQRLVSCTPLMECVDGSSIAESLFGWGGWGGEGEKGGTSARPHGRRRGLSTLNTVGPIHLNANSHGHTQPLWENVCPPRMRFPPGLHMGCQHWGLPDLALFDPTHCQMGQLSSIRENFAGLERAVHARQTYPLRQP